MSSGEMVQINTPRLESTLTNPSDCRFTSRQHALPWISPAHSMEVKSFSQGEAESIFRRYLDNETVEKHRDALLEFAKHVERLRIAIVVGADLLRRELDPVPEAAPGCGSKDCATRCMTSPLCCGVLS